MKKSIIEVKNIVVEDLFSWFSDSINSRGGDGTAAICCENYREVFLAFKIWAANHNMRYLDSDLYEIQESKDTIILYDNTEHYIFTKDDNINLLEGDYIFIVRKDCPAWNKHYPVIKSVKED